MRQLPEHADVRGQIDTLSGQRVRYAPRDLAFGGWERQLSCVQRPRQRGDNEDLWDWVQLQRFGLCLLCLPDALWRQLCVIPAAE